MKEEITIDGLASKMEDGFVSSKQTVDTLAVKVDDLALSVKDVVKSIEDLAIATARGFNDVESRLTKKIETEIQSVRTELSTKIQTETQSVRTDLSAEIQSVRSDLGHKIDSFRSEILGEFRKLEKR